MYRKNTASQFVCFQMLLTATGAVATGLSPAVRRCIDGTFAAGGGTVTEDGTTGSYKYAMAQADTNGNDISLIFSAATAMPVCINFVTTAGDPTDSVRFGLTALPNAAASAIGGLPLAVDTSGRVDVLKINGTSQTARDIGASVLLSTGTGAGQLDFTSGVVKANATQFAGQTITAGAGVTIPSSIASPTNITAATGITVATNSDKTGYALTAAYDPAKTASQAGDAMTLTSGERNAAADALLARNVSGGSSAGRTVKQALHFLRNKWTIATGTLTVYDTDDASSSWTATVGTDAAAVPIVSNDPA